MSVRQMSQVPWFVTAVWPAGEAYAPVSRLTDSFMQVLLVVILVMAPLALLVFRRLMAPLRELGFQISERHLGIRTEPVEIAGGTEVRQVAETFNTVMEERDEVLASLAEREAFFRSLTQSAPIRPMCWAGLSSLTRPLSALLVSAPVSSSTLPLSMASTKRTGLAPLRRGERHFAARPCSGGASA